MCSEYIYILTVCIHSSEKVLFSQASVQYSVHRNPTRPLQWMKAILVVCIILECLHGAFNHPPNTHVLLWMIYWNLMIENAITLHCNSVLELPWLFGGWICCTDIAGAGAIGAANVGCQGPAMTWGPANCLCGVGGGGTLKFGGGTFGLYMTGAMAFGST